MAASVFGVYRCTALSPVQTIVPFSLDTLHVSRDRSPVRQISFGVFAGTRSTSTEPTLGKLQEHQSLTTGLSFKTYQSRPFDRVTAQSMTPAVPAFFSLNPRDAPAALRLAPFCNGAPSASATR